MARGVVDELEPDDVDIRCHELTAVALRTIDFTPDGGQPSAPAARSRQFIGPGVFAILRGQGPIFSRNLAIVAALGTICRRHLAVVDGSDTAVRSLSPPRVSPGAFVCGTLAVGRGAVTGGPVEVTRRVVARFGFSIAQPSRDVTVPRCQPGFPTAQCRQLIRAGILAVLGGVGSIFGRNPAVVDGLGAAVGCLSAARVRSGTFVSRALPIARRAIIGASVEIAGRVVTRFGFAVTQLGGDVALTCRQPGFPAAQGRQLVGLGILAVPGRQCAIVGRNPAVVDGLGAAVRSLSPPRVRPGTRVRGAPPVARSAIPGHSVEITRRVVARFGLPVTQLGREIACPRRQPGDLAVLGGLGAIVRRELAVVDRLGTVVGCFGTTDRGLGTFVRRILAVARRTIPRASVEVTRRVVARFGFSITQSSRDVTVLRSQPGFPAAHARQLVGPGIFEVLGGLRAVFGCHPAVVDGLGAVVGRPRAPRRGPGALIGRMLTVARRAISRGSVEITRCVVTCFGLSVTQPGRDITILRGQSGLSAADVGLLVSSGIFAIPRGLYAVLSCDLAVVDGLRAVVRSFVMP